MAFWAGKPIEVSAAKGIIVGRGEGEFDPKAILTRAEFATMLVKASGLENSNATEDFTDVAIGAWYQPFVAAAVQEGLIYGRSADRFEPLAEVTRAEMAAMAARALKIINGTNPAKNVDAQLAKFSDADGIFVGLKADVALAIRRGIFIGDENGMFAPENNSNRAQAAVVIYNLLNQ